MNRYEKEILRRVEGLITVFQSLVADAEGRKEEESLVYGLRALVCLANMIMRRQEIFGVETWHAISGSAPLSMPGEMLLRLVNYRGEPMPPYPAIMAFYENGFTAAIDSILFLAALEQFRKAPWKEISVNVSARSLRDPDFVRTTLARLETLELDDGRKIIMEIHESMPHLAMSRQVLELYSAMGVGFAIDDVGLNINDALRMGEFEGIAGYIKVDRRAVNAPPGASNNLAKVMGFIRTLVPGAVVVAEGVKNADQALYIHEAFPDVQYVQGVRLPPSADGFALEYHNAKVRKKIQTAL